MSSTATEAMQSEFFGEGADGTPLAVVGGGLTGWASWRPLLPRLTVGRRVILLQPVNVQYGLEGRPLPVGYSVRAESLALKMTLDGLAATSPVDILAWSYGAHIALDFALTHPERLRRLALIEPPALWVLPEHGREHDEVGRLENLIASSAAEVT